MTLTLHRLRQWSLALVIMICFMIPSLCLSNSGPRIRSTAGINSCFKTLKNIFYTEINPDNSVTFNGLTPESIIRLKEARNQYRSLKRLFNQKFYNMQDFQLTYNMGQMAQHHLLVMGGPGGAKSAFVRFLNLGAEIREDASGHRLWVKQLHEQTSPLELIGGQTREALERGQVDINYTNTIVEARYAMIDEGEKAPPATLASLLSAFNERFIQIHGRDVPTDIRSVSFVVNANLYQILKHFEEEGQGTTGPAFLNRLHYKLRVPNWLESHFQRMRENDEGFNRLLRSFELNDPRLLERSRYANFPIVDFEFLEQIAYGVFEPSENFILAVRVLADNYRRQITRLVRESEETPGVERFVPSADITNRLADQISNTILVSLLLDLLDSPLSNNDGIEQLFAPDPFGNFQKIEIDLLSIWRAFPIFTTVGPGKTLFNPRDRSLNFSMTRREGSWRHLDRESLLRSAQNELEINNLTDMFREQDTFKDTLKDIWDDYMRNVENSQRLLNFLDFTQEGPTRSFEVLLFDSRNS